MIGTAALFPGVVTFARPLLLAIDRQNNGIQVELQLRPRLRPCEQLGPQLIVQANYLAYRPGDKRMRKRRSAV